MDIKKCSFNYSLKNIPLPNPNEHIKLVIAKTEELLQRFRWITKFFFDPPKEKQKESFGFKTTRNAPTQHTLNNFEHDMAHLISKFEYEDEISEFQKQLISDKNKVMRSKNLFVAADKTRNIYEVDKKTYNKLLLENVTAHYKLTENNTEQTINEEAKSITDQLEISDKVEPIAKKSAYITLKDHKTDFPNDVKCRLINPTKSNIGKISKILLQNINEKIRNKLQLQQWRSTADTLQWFKNLKNKQNLQFIQIDVVDFYPSITLELYEKAIKFAETVVEISDEHKKILRNARDSILYHNNKSWQKQTGLFDVTMGSYDGCELCELVGLLIIHTVNKNHPEIDFGLYRDDGAGAHNSMSKPQLERLEKKLHKTFEELGLKITCDTKCKNVMNMLDVTFNMQKNTYAPYRKPNDNPVYIHKDSNHPPHIAEQLPKSINKRLNSISSNKDIFDSSKNEYEKALKESKLTHTLNYENKDEKPKNKRRKRKREIIWFTPPWCESLKTNFGREFLELIDKHFPVNNPLHKLFNRRTVKLSYSTTKNFATIIQNHNRKILAEDTQQEENLCNCQKPNLCPVQNKCKLENVVYKATVENKEKKNAIYIGSTTTSFKKRYSNHKKSFNHERYKNDTTLSTYIWNNKLQEDPKIKWKIIKKCEKYKPGGKFCQICIEEKFNIIKGLRKTSNINKKSDIGSKCMHRRNATFAYTIT